MSYWEDGEKGSGKRLLKASLRRSSGCGLGGRGNHLTTPAGGRAEPGTGHRGAVPFVGGWIRWGVVRSIAVLYRTRVCVMNGGEIMKKNTKNSKAEEKRRQQSLKRGSAEPHRNLPG